MPFIERIKPVQEKTGINIKKLVELLREHCVKARGNHGRISAVRLKQRIQFCRLHKLLGKTHVNELGMLRLPHGGWTKSLEEANEHLMDVYFPGCCIDKNIKKYQCCLSRLITDGFHLLTGTSLQKLSPN